MAKINNLLLFFIFLLCTGLTMNASAGLECGDGIVCDSEAFPDLCSEECEDGNILDNDSCVDCNDAFCGDSFVWNTDGGSEECDDMNVTDTDACRNDCTNAFCGDGQIWAGQEECDDGGNENGDGCSDACEVELCFGFTPTDTTCGIGECASTGVTSCDPATGNPIDSCVAGTPSAEICDGLDNSCNGSVDDGIAPEATSCGVGACAADGQTTCEGGTLVDSCNPGTPTEEVCDDGIDNDCDGGVDDLPSCTDLCIDFVSEPTSCGVGVCAAAGQTTCDSATGETGDTCEAGTPTEEVCDGLDNDCDGQTDNGITPVPTSCGVGACAADGQTTCEDGTLVDSCNPGTPTEEVCDDGIDNDCDGGVDDLPSCTDLCIDFVSEPTSCGVGVCAAAGQTTCDSATGETGDSCEAGTPTEEVCDGLDNDCDGQTDNGIADTPTSCGVGECADSGVLSCIDGSNVDSCNPGAPVAEVCDSLDNDCDGLVDEDASCNGATVIIDGCDSGVTDTGGITAGILACEDAVNRGQMARNNHGQFVRCSARFLNGLGLTSEEKEAIQACVGSSDLGKKEKTNGE